jgi:membrane-associated phospholipid phosphatase
VPAKDPVVAAGDDTSLRRWTPVRIACIAVWAVAFVVTTALWGFPASRDRLLVWVITGLLILVVGRPNGFARLVVGFMPVIVFLYAYDLLRGTADGFSSHVYALPQLRVDEWLFGGTAPTITLQRWLYTPGAVHPWDYAAIVVYLTYFVVPITVAAIAWYRAPAVFGRFVTLWIGLSFAALVTYALYPADPPWLASRHGFLPHVVRIAPQLTRDLGVDLTRVMGSKDYVNKVAAVPSLHAATALLISMVFWSRTVRWRWLLVLYPLAMAMALVYLGEHYVSDVLLGWLYAVLVFVFGGRLYDRWSARRARAGPEPDPGTTRPPAMT